MRIRLFLISPGREPDQLDWVQWLDQLLPIEGVAIVVREPGLARSQLVELVTRIKSRWPVIVHAKTPGAALAVAADPTLGLHLPEGTDMATHRRHCRGLLGVSCHDQASVTRALAGGADYVFLSPVFCPTSKPGDSRPPLGLTRFLDLAGGRPVVALGGINATRLRDVLAGGGYAAAMLGGILGANSQEQAQATWLQVRDVLQHLNDQSR